MKNQIFIAFSDVRFVPNADKLQRSKAKWRALFDHLVGASGVAGRHDRRRLDH
jgi:hypothetical protein